MPAMLANNPMVNKGGACHAISCCILAIVALAAFFTSACRLIVIPIATFDHKPYFLEEIANTGRLGLAVWILTMLIIVVAIIGAVAFKESQGYATINKILMPALVIMELVYIITMLTYWSRFQEVTGNDALCKTFLAYIITTLIMIGLVILFICCGIVAACLSGASR